MWFLGVGLVCFGFVWGWGFFVFFFLGGGGVFCFFVGFSLTFKPLAKVYISDRSAETTLRASILRYML